MTSRSTPPPLPPMPPRTTPPPLPPLPGTVARRERSLLARALIGLVLLVSIAMGSAWLLYASIDPAEESRTVPGGDRPSLSTVRSWSYQLQGLDIAEAARSPVDLLVIDETALAGPDAVGSRGRAMTSLKRRPDGGERLVLSYLSIGEAEEYRRYWKPGWTTPAATPTTTAAIATSGAPTPNLALARAGGTHLQANAALLPLQAPSASAPAWLGAENAEWRGNYSVRYWHPEWRALMFGSETAALDRIIAAGFDGIYLDRADVFALWEKERATARADMIALIADLVAYARSKRPGFLVVMQNAEELLASTVVRRSIDGVAKEDLLYGIDGSTKPNSAQDVAASLGYLQLARKDGLPVLAVEYLERAADIEAARTRLRSEGLVPFFGPRQLNRPGPT